MADQDALKRLSAAYRTEVDEVTKERHIAEMSAVIRTAPPAPISTRHALRSRAAGAVAAVLIVAAPVGMAVAAEDAVPGEFLYPLKQVTERVRALVDDDIAATHRVEEAERLVVRGAPIPEITRAIERAQVATSDLVDDGTLGPRLESIRERLRQQDDEERVLVESEELQSGQQNSRGSGGGEADPDGDQDGPGTGSATTSVPRSGGQGEGAGAGSTSGDSTPGDSPPTDGNAGTRGNNGAGETPEREGAGPGGDASPPTTARQGSTGTSGS